MRAHWARAVYREERAAPSPDAAGWAARPLLAGLIHALLLLAPLAAGLVAAWLVAGALPPARGAGVAAEWALIIAASLAAVAITARAARRLMPLPMLLRLALRFPDRAPARYRIAARAGVTRRLKDQVAAAELAGLDDTPTRAAARVLTLMAALAAHDPKTRGHCERVRAYNDLITEQMRLPGFDRERLRWAALLHDIGKLDVPVRVLNKPATLDADEVDVVRRHPLRGLAIAAPLAAWLGEWATGIDQHHERWDGAGYPYGLAGPAIGLGARIVAVADAFEVMTAPRAYARPVGPRAAREELVRCAGSQFDPHVVRAFLDVSLGRLRAVMGPLALVAALPFLPARLIRVPGGVTQAGVAVASAAGAVAIAAAAVGVAGGSPAPQLTPGARPAMTTPSASPSPAPARPARPAGSHPPANAPATPPSTAPPATAPVAAAGPVAGAAAPVSAAAPPPATVGAPSPPPSTRSGRARHGRGRGDGGLGRPAAPGQLMLATRPPRPR